jgi:predicted Zn finger-like uncharacterized protein
MTTRCPACGTAFRVADSQLQARAGQVRCGRCGTLFDALAALTTDSARRRTEAAAAPAAAPAETGTPSRTSERKREFDFGPQPRGRPNPLWWVLSLLLALALAVQVAYHYRGEVAMLLPEAKLLAQRICEELGCEVPLPRRVDLLGIESSDLQADSAQPSVMVLTATLRNRAGYIQEFPALELTLTNIQNQTIARRVLTPADYVPRDTRPESGFAAGGEFQLRVYIEAATLTPTGYRLYLFHM